jgi:hypothetical protein
MDYTKHKIIDVFFEWFEKNRGFILNEYERDMYAYIVQTGMSMVEIRAELEWSHKRMEDVRKSLYSKFDVKQRYQITAVYLIWLEDVADHLRGGAHGKKQAN